MDITTILNSKGPAAAAAAENQFSHLTKSSQINNHMGSETGSEVGNNSDHSSVYSSRSTKALQALPNMPNGMRYPSPSQLQHPMSMLPSGYQPPHLGLENGFVHSQHQDGQHNQGERLNNPSRTSNGNDSVKAFACTTCSKGFARRSDLARHGKYCPR